MFVINWQWRLGENNYITKNNRNLKPFTSDSMDVDCKVWKTRKNAEYYLRLKDPSFAKKCTIEEII